MTGKLPLARSSSLVVQEVADEVLVYDLTTNKAFCLNETSSTVYKACDGLTSVAELKQKTSFSDDVIFLAIDQLQENGLIDSGYVREPYFEGVNRRQVLRTIGAASVAALPIILSLTAPPATHAASACGAQACTGNVDCANPSCPTCQGTGVCSTGGACANIGAPCTTTGTCTVTFICTGDIGPCAGPGTCGTVGVCTPVAGTCSVPGPPCFAAGACNSFPGVCSGTGTCQ